MTVAGRVTLAAMWPWWRLYVWWDDWQDRRQEEVAGDTRSD
jgi:hypothetical protein